MAKYGMAIDLRNCVGCGACGLACKTENNTEFERSGEKFNWADFYIQSGGTFAEGNFKYQVYPVLCNHCTDAPCIANCPVTPKAIYKTPDGITMHDNAKCIGCKRCQRDCPYSTGKVLETNDQYSVISYNNWDMHIHALWKNKTAVIPGGTATPEEVALAADKVPPYKNEFTGSPYNAVRPTNVTEKCYFCEHRVKNGEKPYCVVSCPSGARIFGDLNDSSSQISKAIANGYKQLKNNNGEFLAKGEKGTQPNVFYVGDFSIATPVKRPEIKPEVKLKVYPNPVMDDSTLEFSLSENAEIYVSIIDLSGRTMKYIVNGEWYPQGKHTVRFNVDELKNGQYIVCLQTQNNRLTTNILVAK